MQKNLEYGFDFGCCIKLSIKSHFLKKLKKVHLIIFKVCTFNKICVSQSLNILRKLNIWKLYIRRGFGILFSWFGSILLNFSARNIRPFDMDGNLYQDQDQAKIEYNSWNSFENIKSISKNVKISTGNFYYNCYM